MSSLKGSRTATFCWVNTRTTICSSHILYAGNDCLPVASSLLSSHDPTTRYRSLPAHPGLSLPFSTSYGQNVAPYPAARIKQPPKKHISHILFVSPDFTTIVRRGLVLMTTMLEKGTLGIVLRGRATLERHSAINNDEFGFFEWSQIESLPNAIATTRGTWPKRPSEFVRQEFLIRILRKEPPPLRLERLGIAPISWVTKQNK
jgi:hypothetical protein